MAKSPGIPTWLCALLLWCVSSAHCSPLSGIILQGPQCLQEHWKHIKGRALLGEIYRTHAGLLWHCAGTSLQADSARVIHCSIHTPFSSTLAQPQDTVFCCQHVVQLWRTPLRREDRIGFFSKTVATLPPNPWAWMLVICWGKGTVLKIHNNHGLSHLHTSSWIITWRLIINVKGLGHNLGLFPV